jgi:hypothetical protein
MRTIGQLLEWNEGGGEKGSGVGEEREEGTYRCRGIGRKKIEEREE